MKLQAKKMGKVKNFLHWFNCQKSNFLSPPLNSYSIFTVVFLHMLLYNECKLNAFFNGTVKNFMKSYENKEGDWKNAKEAGMKTLTIRGIDPELSNEIKKCAKENNKSINSFVLKILKSTFGIEKKREFPIYHDLDHLAGQWSAADETEFLNNTKAFEMIDKEMWP